MIRDKKEKIFAFTRSLDLTLKFNFIININLALPNVTKYFLNIIEGNFVNAKIKNIIAELIEMMRGKESYFDTIIES